METWKKIKKIVERKHVDQTRKKNKEKTDGRKKTTERRTAETQDGVTDGKESEQE